jgi:hypothetical protein
LEETNTRSGNPSPPKGRGIFAENIMKLGVESLSGLRAAESTLRREEARKFIDGLPEGHPLEDDVERLKAEAGGDLASLPDGHPLLREIKAAKERYEQDIVAETDQSQERSREVRRAKKIERASKRREDRDKEEQQGIKLRIAATDVNNGIDAALGAVRGLYESLSMNEGILSTNRMNTTRVARLKRLLYAFERGVSESKMGRA